MNIRSRFLFAILMLPLQGAAGQTLNPPDLQLWLRERTEGTRHFLLIDVRTPGEHANGFIPGTDTLFPLQDFQMGKVQVPVDPKTDTVVVYCRTGHRAGIVQNLLKQQGFRFVFNGLGIVQWQGAGYPLIQGQRASQPPVFYTLRGEGAIGMLAQARTPRVWNAGKNMTYLTITPDGQKILASSPAEDRVYVLSALTGKPIQIIPVGKTPKGIKAGPNGQIALVAEEGNNTLGVIDLKTWQRIREIPVGTKPHNIVFNHTGTRAYVTVQGDDRIAEVDLQAFKVLRSINVDGAPHNLDITPDDQRLLVANMQSNDVAVIDLEAWKIIQRIPVSPGHHGVDITPDGRYALVTGIGADTLNLIDLKTLKRVKTVVVGKGPHGVRATPSGDRAFVALALQNEVVEVSLPDFKVVQRYPTKAGPFWITVQGNP